MSDTKSDTKCDTRSEARSQAGILALAQTGSFTAMEVFSSPEEITLLFATHDTFQSSDNDVRAAADRRIVLSPYTAKRLARMLEQGLAEYEKRFGKTER